MSHVYRGYLAVHCSRRTFIERLNTLDEGILAFDDNLKRDSFLHSPLDPIVISYPTLFTKPCMLHALSTSNQRILSFERPGPMNLI